MQRRNVSNIVVALALTRCAFATGHGPVFALATPTNPKGGFSLDTSIMGRYGDGGGTMDRTELGYGITQDLKISISAPVMFQTEPFVPARFSAFMPMGGDFETLAVWRFQRSDTGVGSRFETAAIGGLLLPGPQASGGPLNGLHSGPGVLAGIVTGFASRSHYAWVGVTYQAYAASHRDRRPGVLFYSATYAYRPRAWRRDSGWDWRIFGELTGENTAGIVRNGAALPRSGAGEVFVGPSALGVYKNYAVSAGVQFPIYRDASALFPHERVRVAMTLSYFF